MTTATHRLYGGEISYFTGKVRAYLRCKGIPYLEQTADRSVYKEVIMPRVGWPVIPVVVTADDVTLQDSSDIIDAFEARYPAPSVYPATPRQCISALLLELYGDEWLKLPAMHYRWNHNTDWIIQEFGRLSRPDLDAAGQRAVGAETCKPFRGSLPRLGVTEATAGAIETSYEALLLELDSHFENMPFVFGERPTIGDFGLIGPLYAHQYRDPASGALMERIAPRVAEWVRRVHEPADVAALGAGALLSDDRVPATLEPVLRRCAREFGPVLKATASALKAWVAAHPGGALPRVIGDHEYELEGVREQRAIFPFELWMLQRAADRWRALDAPTQTALAPWFDGLQLLDLLQLEFPRLERRNFQLALA